MSQFRLAARLADALKGQQHLVIAAPRRAFTPRFRRAVLRGSLGNAARRLLDDAPEGGDGRVLQTSLATGSLRRLTLILLPDDVSRHLSPSRSHALAEGLAKAGLGRAGKTAVVACVDRPEHVTAAANAVGRCLPLYSRKSQASKGQPIVTLAAVDAEGAFVSPGPAPGAVAEGARWAAAMVDRPTAELTTASFVDEARVFLKGLRGVKATVLVGAELLEQGLGGIHAVGRAAVVPPRLLILEHAPRGAKRTVALVGKGIVFDTGGLDIKGREGMNGMKGDMGGGAAVVGAFRALVALKCPDRLLCLVALAENSVGPDSFRPDEILKLHSGKTVEINNTDAEGRLVVADALSYVTRTQHPDVVIDAATLTGAQLIATGRRHAAIVSNLAGLERRAVAAGLVSGDTVHPLPFAPELYQSEFKSVVADMKNSVRDRANAQASCAAQFIWSHVSDANVPWLHVDMAGPSTSGERGTGYGVALLTELVQTLEDGDLRQ